MKKKSKPNDKFEAAWMKDIQDEKTVTDDETNLRLAGKMMVDQSLKKTHPLSLRIPDADLEAIQLKAARAGIPYQTLIKSILHQFATDQL
jgi:predicted DNA binding CopG/RHH family protein